MDETDYHQLKDDTGGKEEKAESEGVGCSQSDSESSGEQTMVLPGCRPEHEGPDSVEAFRRFQTAVFLWGADITTSAGERNPAAECLPRDEPKCLPPASTL